MLLIDFTEYYFLFFRFILLAIGWALFSMSFYSAATSSLDEVLWDPYAILELDTVSSSNFRITN